MCAGWSLWVMSLIVFNLGITLFLFLWGPRAKIPTQPDGTSGHVWAHGTLREGMRRLPRWWLLFSASMFVAGFSYLALYPGFGNAKGMLGWTSRGQLARDVAANNVKLDDAMKGFDNYPVEQVAYDPAAQPMGRMLFEDNCAACHGRAGTGNPLLGAPNLTDHLWLYGGSAADIHQTIHDGRQGHMPSWSPRLSNDQIHVLAAYVYRLSHPADASNP